jgi:acyl-CoA reductase-like NAD-dependent aldehyde dehydrogenase
MTADRSTLTLSDVEARVAGVLMEKSVTTPDNYPLSLNATVTACNQTTNRDPVVHYDERTVEAALDALRERGVVRRIKAAGQRVIKYRHTVDEVLGLDAPELALVGVLLLRGAQTPGELKARTERWHRFESLDAVEGSLAQLAAQGMVEQLPRRPGQKETRWTDLLRGAVAGSVPARGSEPQDVPGAASPARDHSLDVRNPADGSFVRRVAVDSEREITAKLERGRVAQPAWAALGYEERAVRMRQFGGLLASERDECAAITTSETGKPIWQARAEMDAVLERVEWNVAHAERVLATQEVTPGGSVEVTAERITFEPVGVVAHVSAWNYPYFVALNSVVPALLTGNVVLYKPSEHATLTGLRLVDLLQRAGVPRDVVQAVVGAGATGAELVSAPVDLVCFTGSYPTGRRVAAAAAERLVPVQLELGGKDPAYVCDDVDVDAAALAVAEGVFYNGGQSCCAVERCYVHERVYDAFAAALADVARAYRVGDPTDEQTDIGPLARPEQVAVLDAQVRDAVAKGARVLCGGAPLERPGNWFAPTVLADADHRMTVMRDESFGPVIGVQPVRDDDEAAALMADTPYGLTAAVFSRNEERATRILRDLDVGTAYWNCADRTSVRLPWAGRRNSGLGVSLGEAGLRVFVRPKAWHARPLP